MHFPAAKQEPCDADCAYLAGDAGKGKPQEEDCCCNALETLMPVKGLPFFFACSFFLKGFC